MLCESVMGCTAVQAHVYPCPPGAVVQTHFLFWNGRYSGSISCGTSYWAWQALWTPWPAKPSVPAIKQVILVYVSFSGKGERGRQEGREGRILQNGQGRPGSGRPIQHVIVVLTVKGELRPFLHSQTLLLSHNLVPDDVYFARPISASGFKNSVGRCICCTSTGYCKVQR